MGEEREKAEELRAAYREGRTSDFYIGCERLVNRAISTAFMKEDPHDSIRSILEFIGETLVCDRAYIFEFSRSNQLNNTYEWCAPGVRPVIGMLQDVSLEVYAPYWLPRFLRHEYIMIPDRDIPDMEAYAAVDPPMYRLLRAQDIHTLLAAPIYLEKKFIGFVGVDNPPPEAVMPVVTLFQMLTSIIGVLLRHRNNWQRLQKLAYCDQLTGLGNRSAWVRYVEQLDRKNPIGLIFGDLNGLKQMNDTFGHEGGDLMICQAAQAMQKFAGERGKVFRMGGDEFLIIYADIERKAFQQETARLKASLRAQDVNISLGIVWHENALQNFDVLVTEADFAMYRKKEAYHQRQRCRICPIVEDRKNLNGNIKSDTGQKNQRTAKKCLTSLLRVSIIYFVSQRGGFPRCGGCGNSSVVEHHLAKVGVASSSLVFRSIQLAGFYGVWAYSSVG